jgi:uncharacterized damage-inducible protein DinB
MVHHHLTQNEPEKNSGCTREIADSNASLLGDIVQWYRYNSRVRKKYLRTLSKLPKSKLFKRTEASFPTVLQILVHVLDAYRWWFIYVSNDRIMEYQRMRTEVKTIAEAEKLESEVDSLVMRYVETLNSEDLKREITWHENGKIEKININEMLHHMIEEELQHRGEMNAVLWEMGVEPPVSEWQDMF